MVGFSVRFGAHRDQRRGAGRCTDRGWMVVEVSRRRKSAGASDSGLQDPDMTASVVARPHLATFFLLAELGPEATGLRSQFPFAPSTTGCCSVYFTSGS